MTTLNRQDACFAFAVEADDEDFDTEGAPRLVQTLTNGISEWGQRLR
jgi:hypothetical protein